MTLRVRQFGDPMLRQMSAPITAGEINAPEVTALIDTMKGVLDGIKAISDENGNAISAPQVGSLKRLVLLRLNGEFVVLINPKIIHASDQRFAFDEECFSFYQLRGEVMRHSTVTVRYTDTQGVEQVLTLSGEEAGIAQHEIDHLDGILFIDRVEDSKTLQSVDHLLAHEPGRLAVVKQLSDYMAAPLST